MTRVPVSSSNLRAVGYDPASKKLEIEFNSGGIYQYSNVPSGIHSALMNAGSKGSYFSSYIKKGYRFNQIR